MRLAPLAFAALLASSAVQAATPGFHVIDRIAGPDGGWDYVSVEAGRALIARNAAVTAMDLKSRAVTPAFAPATKGHAALVVNDGKEVLITNGGTDTVTFVDAISGAPIASVATGKKPDAATFDPRSGLVLVMDHAGGDVTLIDPKAHKAVGAIPIGGALEAGAPAADGAGQDSAMAGVDADVLMDGLEGGIAAHVIDLQRPVRQYPADHQSDVVPMGGDEEGPPLPAQVHPDAALVEPPGRKTQGPALVQKELIQGAGEARGAVHGEKVPKVGQDVFDHMDLQSDLFITCTFLERKVHSKNF